VSFLVFQFAGLIKSRFAQKADWSSPVILHTDHCAKKLLPWMDGMLDADEAYFKQHGEPLFS
jgi:fructose/tagatose bisphosphate aldolase